MCYNSSYRYCISNRIIPSKVLNAILLRRLGHNIMREDNIVRIKRTEGDVVEKRKKNKCGDLKKCGTVHLKTKIIQN